MKDRMLLDGTTARATQRVTSLGRCNKPELIPYFPS